MLDKIIEAGKKIVRQSHAIKFNYAVEFCKNNQNKNGTCLYSYYEVIKHFYLDNSILTQTKLQEAGLKFISYPERIKETPTKLRADVD